jgi:hypothetical protein
LTAKKDEYPQEKDQLKNFREERYKNEQERREEGLSRSRSRNISQRKPGRKSERVSSRSIVDRRRQPQVDTVATKKYAPDKQGSYDEGQESFKEEEFIANKAKN